MALAGVSFTVDRGELVAIVGPSGSGKSTLLHLMGTLDRPSSGIVRLTGLDVARLTDRELSALRATRIGFVFQQFFLAEHATVLENVADGLLYSGAGAVGSAQAGGRGARQGRSQPSGRVPADAALGWGASARRDRAGARRSACDRARRRADRQPRQRHRRRDRRAARSAPCRRSDDRGDHPRPRPGRATAAPGRDARRPHRHRHGQAARRRIVIHVPGKGRRVMRGSRHTASLAFPAAASERRCRSCRRRTRHRRRSRDRRQRPESGVSGVERTEHVDTRRRQPADGDAGHAVRRESPGGARQHERVSADDVPRRRPGHLQRARERRQRSVRGQRLEHPDGRHRRLRDGGGGDVQRQRHRRQLHDHRQLGVRLGLVRRDQQRSRDTGGDESRRPSESVGHSLDALRAPARGQAARREWETCCRA